MVLTLLTPTERQTIVALRNMVSNMIVPEHDEYLGHSKRTCPICITMKNADAMLGYLVLTRKVN